MIIKGADIDGKRLDVRLSKGLIAQIAPQIEGHDITLEASGGALLPGLHDHHIHLNASAAAMQSLRCGPPDVTNLDALSMALMECEGTDWIRGVGYHQSIGEIDRDWLDRQGPDCPIRIQHRSGRQWIFNSRAMELLGLKAPKDGKLVDGDKALLGQLKSRFPDLGPLTEKLHAYGLTGVTEVTPSNGIAEFENYGEQVKNLRLCIMGNESLSDLKRGCIGPLKLHYHDHNLPGLDALTAQIEMAHNAGRTIAAHCVTRAEIMLTLAALEQAGPLRGDRIEHAAIADDGIIEWMQKLGVIVVTQPNFIAERIDAYRQDVPRVDHQNLWRLRSFITADLSVAAGSDAPFGDPNPWAAMAAAVNRPFGFGDESITPEQALALYTKPHNDAGAQPRKVAIGQPADLCLIDKSWAAARQSLSAVTVKATFIGARRVF